MWLVLICGPPEVFNRAGWNFGVTWFFKNSTFWWNIWTICKFSRCCTLMPLNSPEVWITDGWVSVHSHHYFGSRKGTLYMEKEQTWRGRANHREWCRRVPRGLRRRKCHWIKWRAEAPVTLVPLSTLTWEPLPVVWSGWELTGNWRMPAYLESFGSEGKDRVRLRGSY